MSTAKTLLFRIPELRERLHSLDLWETPQVYYVHWTGIDNPDFGLRFGDILKIDKVRPVQNGEFADVIVYGSPLDTIARVIMPSEDVVELWMNPTTCWPLRRSRCQLRRIVGRFHLEETQRVFLGKRLARVSMWQREQLAEALESGSPSKDVNSSQGQLQSLTNRGRILYLRPLARERVVSNRARKEG